MGEGREKPTGATSNQIFETPGSAPFIDPFHNLLKLRKLYRECQSTAIHIPMHLLKEEVRRSLRRRDEKKVDIETRRLMACSPVSTNDGGLVARRSVSRPKDHKVLDVFAALIDFLKAESLLPLE